MSLPDSLRGRRPTWVEVDLNRLESNFLALRKVLPRPVKIMAVIKADAYGHGGSPVALRLQQLGVDALAVAILEEALVLRKAGVNCPLLLLNGFWPGQEEDIIHHELTPVVFRPDMLHSLEKAAARAERPVCLSSGSEHRNLAPGRGMGRGSCAGNKSMPHPHGRAVKGCSLTLVWRRMFKMVQPKHNWNALRSFWRPPVSADGNPRGVMPPTAQAS